MDAVVTVRDLTELGLEDEYNSLFGVPDSQTTVDNILLASRNHDMSFAYKQNSKDYYSYDINGYTFIWMRKFKFLKRPIF